MFPSRRRIGLTGGISTGKTTVARYLADNYRLPVLDADIYAREAVKPGSPILTEIFNRYGNIIQLSDRSLDRKALGEIIFNFPQEKRWLESKIHPYVRDRFQTELEQINTDTVVLVIPLLFESNMTDLATEIWVVSCNETQQIERLMQRDRLTEEQAQARIDSQFPLAKKIAAADVVLDNSSTTEALLKQIDRSLISNRSPAKVQKFLNNRSSEVQ
jgi:dephospho-CoA kinase